MATMENRRGVLLYKVSVKNSQCESISEDSESDVFEEIPDQLAPQAIEVDEEATTMEEEANAPPAKRGNKRAWTSLQLDEPESSSKEYGEFIYPVILSCPDKRLSDLSPVTLQVEIKSICVPNDMFEIATLVGGDIIVRPTMRESSRNLLQMTSLGELQINAKIPNRMKYTKCVIRKVSAMLTTEDIAKELGKNGVVNARFMCKKPHDKENMDGHFHTVVLEIEKMIAPETVYLFHQRYRVLKYKEKPRLCHKCNLYGHSEKICPRNPRCSRCKGPHTSSECRIAEPSQKCINCGKVGHEVNDPACKTRIQATKVVRGKFEVKSYRDAVVENRAIKAPRGKLYQEGKKAAKASQTEKENENSRMCRLRAREEKNPEIAKKIFYPRMKSIGIQCNVELEPLGVEPPNDCLGETNKAIDQHTIEEIIQGIIPKAPEIIKFLAKRNTAEDRAVLRALMARATLM